jgi:hypothetical protein
MIIEVIRENFFATFNQMRRNLRALWHDFSTVFQKAANMTNSYGKNKSKAKKANLKRQGEFKSDEAIHGPAGSGISGQSSDQKSRTKKTGKISSKDNPMRFFPV